MHSKPTILILSSYPVQQLPGNEILGAGGVFATWLPQLAEGFREVSDLDIHWVTFSKNVSAYQKTIHKNQTFHVFPRGKASVQACTIYWAERRKIKKLVKQLKPCVVHAWGTEDVYGLAAADFKGRSVLSVQGILTHYCRIVRSPHCLQRLQAFYERCVWRKVSMLTCESNWGIEMLKSLGVTAPVRRMEHGVNPAFYEAKWSPDPVRPTALFVGTVNEAKGIKDLMAAFGRNELSVYQLVIAGDGPLREQAQTSGLTNVKCLGRISPQELIAELERAWCLVLPTRVDTSPNVVKEARVVGLPVVTTPCGGQADYIEHGVNGALVAPQDIDGLVNALHSIMSNFDNCQALGANLHSQARDYFSHRNTVKHLLTLYRQT